MPKVDRSPTERLAINGKGQGEVNGALATPAGRLALGADIIKSVGEKALGPSVRRVGQSGGGANTSILPTAFGDALDCPALLVSYVYLEPFLKNRERYHYRDWVMDSGAFSAHNSGTEIKLADYTRTCKEFLESDPTLSEVYALDVIGDWKQSVKNTEWMWKKRVPAIPTYHIGEPWDVLLGLAKDYPKVALGGLVGHPKGAKLKFIEQCFARVWPKKLHGFGLGSEYILMGKKGEGFPFHSVDATNWEIGPCKFGQWNAFGGKLSVRGSKQNLRAEVEWYLDLERRARYRWRKEMELLETQGPDVRLVVGTGRSTDEKHIEKALGKKKKPKKP